MITYSDFIKSINNGDISEITFGISGYAHYSNCRIFRTADSAKNGGEIPFITVQLTKDEYEKVSFYKKFDENCKLFHLGKQGTFTLKQIWNKVQIHSILQDETVQL